MSETPLPPPVIILDTRPLSNCVVDIEPDAVPTTPSEVCRQWLWACERQGARILVPAIAYYEALREAERRQATAQIARLKIFSFQPGRFVPLSTEHLEHAAELWGQARRAGQQTSGDAALDGDMILCAQVLSLRLSPADYVVATTNVKHLTLFVNAVEWEELTP